MGKGPKVGGDVFQGFGSLAKSFGNTAQGWLNTAAAPIKSAKDFWQGILSGGNTGGQQLVAPSAMQISQVYQGNDRALKNFMPAGGERNLAVAQNQNQRAQSIADLYRNVQPYAAQQLADLGLRTAGAGTGVGQVGTQGFGSLVDYQGQRNQAKGSALGGIGSGLGSIAGAGILRCWIAEALYGVLDERTFAIRYWLMRGKLPWHWKVFNFLYGVTGQKLAEVLRARPELKRFVRPLFDRAFHHAMRREVA